MDKIAPIIQGFISANAYRDSLINDIGLDNESAEMLAKQIRQQIGRELLDNPDIGKDVEDAWWIDRIERICGLGEE